MLPGSSGLEEAAIRSTFDRDRRLQALLDEIAQQPEKANEIAFASAVSTDQDVKRTKLEILQSPDGLEAFDSELFDGIGHGPSPSISERSAAPPGARRPRTTMQ